MVGDDGVLRAVKDLDGGDAGDIFQIIFQNIGLAQRSCGDRQDARAYARGTDAEWYIS